MFYFNNDQKFEGGGQVIKIKQNKNSIKEKIFMSYVNCFE